MGKDIYAKVNLFAVSPDGSFIPVCPQHRVEYQDSIKLVSPERITHLPCPYCVKDLVAGRTPFSIEQGQAVATEIMKRSLEDDRATAQVKQAIVDDPSFGLILLGLVSYGLMRGESIREIYQSWITLLYDHLSKPAEAIEPTEPES